MPAARAIVESLQITRLENVSGIAAVILFARRDASRAAQNSRRGMVVTFSGATRYREHNSSQLMALSLPLLLM